VDDNPFLTNLALNAEDFATEQQRITALNCESNNIISILYWKVYSIIYHAYCTGSQVELSPDDEVLLEALLGDITKPMICSVDVSTVILKV
jgi:hypothetical protein